MKLIQMVNTLAEVDGGPARNSFELNLALNRRPDTTAMLVSITPDWDRSVATSYEQNGGALPTISARYLRGNHRKIDLVAWARVVRAADATIVHGYFLLWVPVVVVVSRMLGTPVFLMPHGALTHHELRQKPRKKALFQSIFGVIVLRLVACVVVGSAQERQDIESRFPGTPVRVAGVGTSLPDKAPVPRNLSHPVRLLTLSRLAPKKRIDLAIRALAELKSDGRSAHLTVAGTGDKQLEGELRALARELGVDDGVEFAGMVAGPTKEAVLLQSDIFLLPSEDENFGIALAEAAAHGLVVVASSNVASARLLPVGVAYTTSLMSSSALSAAVARAICDYRPEVREAAYSSAKNVFDWSVVAGKWLQTILDESETRK